MSFQAQFAAVIHILSCCCIFTCFIIPFWTYYFVYKQRLKHCVFFNLASFLSLFCCKERWPFKTILEVAFHRHELHKSFNGLWLVCNFNSFSFTQVLRARTLHCVILQKGYNQCFKVFLAILSSCTEIQTFVASIRNGLLALNSKKQLHIVVFTNESSNFVTFLVSFYIFVKVINLVNNMTGSRTARRTMEFGRTYVVRPKGKHQATMVWLHGLGDNGSRQVPFFAFKTNILWLFF